MLFPVRAAVPAVAALVVVLTSCGGAAAPPAAPAPPPPPPTPTSTPVAVAPTSRTSPPGPPTCTASLDGDTGTSSIEGSGQGHMYTGDSGLFLGCGTGPEVRTQIAPGRSLVFTLGDTTTRVRPGTTARVGPYTIEVRSLKGSAATFVMTLPSL